MTPSSLVRTCTISTLLCLVAGSSAFADALVPLANSDTSRTTTAPAKDTTAQFELTLRTANESNGTDAVFGPITYGLLGTYTFSSNLRLEATFIRMHEPEMKPFDSFLDEGQLLLQFPADGFTLDGTVWKSRMMDMYTTLGGMEVARPLGDITIQAGLYAGTASREEVSGRFLGAQISLSTEIGILELTLQHLAGTIHLSSDPTTFGVGQYHHTTLEAGLNLAESLHFPLKATFAIERRYFHFGEGGPTSEPIDTYIGVVGIEVSVSDP